MSKRLTFSSLVKFGSKKRSTERRKSKIFFLLDSLCTRQLYLGCDWSTEEKWLPAESAGNGKLAISAPVTYCPDLIRSGIRDISGARGGHFDAKIELINKVKSDLSGIMHRLYVSCSSHHYIWNPWAFVPGFCPLFSVFLRDRLIKTIMAARKENKSSFNR